MPYNKQDGMKQTYKRLEKDNTIFITLQFLYPRNRSELKFCIWFLETIQSLKSANKNISLKTFKFSAIYCCLNIIGKN